jgi:NAD-dependent DNA ligase
VAGEKAGSKVSEARKLGIRVIGEAEFVELIGGG